MAEWLAGGNREAYLFLMVKLDPIVSEFDTDEDAEAYDKWFRAQVDAGLTSKGPWIPHDEVMAGVRAIIEGERRAGDA